MVKQKKKVVIKCPDCEKPIIGFSEHHAKQNLLIHQMASIKCKEIRAIIKKRFKK